MGMLCSDGRNDQDPLKVGMGRIPEQNQGSVRKGAVGIGADNQLCLLVSTTYACTGFLYFTCKK